MLVLYITYLLLFGQSFM